MKCKFKIGDRIRITDRPSAACDYFQIDDAMFPFYDKLKTKWRAFVIEEIEEDCCGWVRFCFKENGKLKTQMLLVCDFDTNWVKIKERKKHLL